MGIEKPCVDVTCFLLLQDGNTSLHHASRNGRKELCKLLLRAKADVEAKDKVLDPCLAIPCELIFSSSRITDLWSMVNEMSRQCGYGRA